jgi:hypothetical protein
MRRLPSGGLAWTPWLRVGYLGFVRPGGYYCAGIGIYRERPIEFWIKLPTDELRDRRVE